MRKRLFGVLFLLVWMGGMYLCWGWPLSPLGWDPKTDGTLGYEYSKFGFTGWLSRETVWRQVPASAADTSFQVEPRGLVTALIITAVSSLILYVGWRAAVGGFACARGVCDGCGYDLRALSASRCPECGEVQRGAGLR